MIFRSSLCLPILSMFRSLVIDAFATSALYYS
jgi:hypothetical protein